MSPSRKRQKELNRLRADALDVWEAQQAVIGHANVVARQAGQQAQNYSREELVPRVREGFDQYVRPGVQAGTQFSKQAANAAGDVITGRVVPAVGAALGTALSVADVAKDTRVQAAIKRLNGAKADVAQKTKSGPGFGTYLAIALGAAAVIGVVYAVWQTFRADDELWVADDETPEAPSGE